jgi:ubiquinone/menaquinone biosynthesis methyltransferase
MRLTFTLQSEISPPTHPNAAEFHASADNVFARIAGRYDRLCDVFSLLLHRGWKRRMAKKIAAHPARIILDAGSGTGDIPLRVLKRQAAPARATRILMVTDLCPEMLAMAKRKLPAPSASLQFALADAENFAGVESASVDLYSMSFGMKICDRSRAVAEAFRVLKPGGTFFCLEAARIPFEPLHLFYLAYMRWCLPLIGRIAANGDASAYDYLLRGVHDFPSQRAFAAELETAGFTRVTWENLTFGIVAIHEARKPG